MMPFDGPTQSKQKFQWQIACWLILGFVLWVYCLRGFLTLKLSLSSDALSYYDHTKFFVENLGHGIYPLWDPFWLNGAPNDFFLRRIGALNPIYFLLLIFKSCGIPYTLAYFWFLAAYYFSGMIAFYLLVMRIYQNRFIAYTGFLILIFSSLGTRLFDSYMMLVTVPLIWFFYFLVAFSQSPRKDRFLGVVLSLMVLVGTYIPLYFFVILFLFLGLYSLLYFKDLGEMARRYGAFFKSNKFFVVISAVLLILSFVPIISFFHESSHGQVVLPLRHGSLGSTETLTVPHQTLDWGVIEDLMYSSYFSNLRLFKFAVVYVPFFSIILISLGLIGRINRRAVLIFLLGTVLFCCIVPYGFPFYDFLYQHVFVLKYFRNLHFFIWFFLMPLFVLLALEHLNMFFQISFKNSRHRIFLFVYVLLIHLGFILFIWLKHDAVLSTYEMIVLSFVLFSLMVFDRLKPNFWGFALLTLTIFIQPLEAYHYLALKADPYTGKYTYDFSYFQLRNDNIELSKPQYISTAKEPLYYAAGNYNFVYQNISKYALTKYLNNKFILVDHLVSADKANWVPQLEGIFLKGNNVAILSKGKETGLRMNSEDPRPPSKPQALNDNTSSFKILDFNANHLRLWLNLPFSKFLVYNDSYDPLWTVSINHAQVPLYEVNGAFKGVWVDAGSNIIEFNYGQWWQYALNTALSLVALILLIGIIFYACFP